MKNATRSLIVLLIVAMFFFISCDDTLTHDMDDDVEVDEDEQVVATRTVTWVNYDGEVLHTADVEKNTKPQTTRSSRYRKKFQGRPTDYNLMKKSALSP